MQFTPITEHHILDKLSGLQSEYSVIDSITLHCVGYSYSLTFRLKDKKLVTKLISGQDMSKLDQEFLTVNSFIIKNMEPTIIKHQEKYNKTVHSDNPIYAEQLEYYKKYMQNILASDAATKQLNQTILHHIGLSYKEENVKQQQYVKLQIEQLAKLTIPDLKHLGYTIDEQLVSKYSDSSVSLASAAPRELRKVFPGLNVHVKCPVEGCGQVHPLQAQIIHLNDGVHQWSREAIADWLESLDVDITMKEE